MQNVEAGYERRKTRVVRVGEAFIGGDYPVLVQTMATEKTYDVPRVVSQIVNLQRGGAELVRVAVETWRDAKALPFIKEQLNSLGVKIPLSADIHHRGTGLALEALKWVDKVRVNPGLLAAGEGRTETEEDYTQVEIEQRQEENIKALKPIVEECKRREVAMRIGVNHGSLSNLMMVRFGDTPLGMVESALEYIKICEELDFRNIILSLKASRVSVMQGANRLMVERMDQEGMDYPLHLGLTEAGNGQEGRVKSVVALGPLLQEGIGDTIRISLTENPINELSVCFDLLQALGIRKEKVEIISCPSCGRTKINLEPHIEELKGRTGHLKDLTLSGMGCVVNGPGESADSDYGFIVLGEGKVVITRGADRVMSGVREDEAVDRVIELIKSDGRWIDPPKDVV